jgi:hypothetical protein
MGKEAGVHYTEGNTKTPPRHKYFIEGWWSSDEAGNKRITEALVGDHVYFHVKTKHIPDGESIYMRMFDYDNTEEEKVVTKEEKKEKDKNDKKDFQSIGQTTKVNGVDTYKEVNEGIVNDSKVVRGITLNNLENSINTEQDKQLEYYFRCSYKNENIELPISPSNYLKVKGMPKIIFINGHWNKIAHKIGMSPGSGGKSYWDFFTGNLDGYINGAKSYLNIKELQKDPYFIDGSSLWGGSESGGERKERGYNYAKDNFSEIVKGLGGQPIFLISHSEGGACAAGVARYLIEKSINIGESIMLSTDEGDEFSVEGNYNAYQVVAGYITKDIFTKDDIFCIDPVVLDNKVKGITKYGVFISNAGLTTVHGETVDVKTFTLISQLKQLQIQQAWNSKGDIVYQTNPKDENWAKIDDYILYNKKVDLYPTSNSSPLYFRRKD